MNEVILFLALLDDRSLRGLDREFITPPNVVNVALRMVFLKKGMTRDETRKTLGVEKYIYIGVLGYGSHYHWCEPLPLWPGFRINLVYGSDRLLEAGLEWDLRNSRDLFRGRRRISWLNARLIRVPVPAVSEMKSHDFPNIFRTRSCNSIPCVPVLRLVSLCRSNALNRGDE